jgi:hypothetical protein
MIPLLRTASAALTTRRTARALALAANLDSARFGSDIVFTAWTSSSTKPGLRPARVDRAVRD